MYFLVLRKMLPPLLVDFFFWQGGGLGWDSIPGKADCLKPSEEQNFWNKSKFKTLTKE